MKVSEILDEKSINIGLSVDSKEELIEQLIFLTEKQGKILDRDEVKKEVFEREKIMSTGVGKGIALPHAKTNAISDVCGAIAILKEPIDYDSLDKEPVQIAFLLLGLDSNVGLHLRLLSKISRLMNSDSFRSQLLEQKTPKDIIELIKKYEEKD